MPYKKRILRRRPRRLVQGKKKTSMTAVKRVVKQAIAREVEHKTYQFRDDTVDIYPSSNPLFSGSVFPLSPYAVFTEIAQGVGEANRIGNKIKITKCQFQGVIYPKPYNATSNPTPTPTDVIMWIVCDKDNTTTIPDPSNTTFLNNNNGSMGLQNRLTDLYSPINTDRWMLFAKKRFKIGFANNAGTGTTPAQQAYANNDYKYNAMFNIDITKYLVKSIKYNDNSNIPLTRGLYVFFQCLAADGGQYASTVVPCRVDFNINTTYTDA